MDFRKLAANFGALAPLGLILALAACDHADITINGEKGKPLAELDLAHATARQLVLLGPDTVRVHPGDKLAIHVEGDSEPLRFTLKDDALGILRKPGTSSSTPIIIDVTMPAPTGLTMGGSGQITADEVAPSTKINILGSGSIETPHVASSKLEVSIAGTGNYKAKGTSSTLELNIAGTGSAQMGDLKVDTADVSIAGTGDAQFASDGTVKASIIGTGSVHIKGRATCQVSAVGTGKVVCEP
ncbi:MAG: DUF2807 domain-containing protein [Sphingomonadales bacterium]|nr:DUF2807 domain-containing protein [Sphingomonadales bacterium]MDE2170847.1 DUF2807 domain-containing protein [Sphingomonadales bacterium]